MERAAALVVAAFLFQVWYIATDHVNYVDAV